MSYATFDVEIDNGRIKVKEPDKLPLKGPGLLILLPKDEPASSTAGTRTRVQLPLLRGDGKRLINPTREDLDAGF